MRIWTVFRGESSLSREVDRLLAVITALLGSSFTYPTYL